MCALFYNKLGKYQAITVSQFFFCALQNLPVRHNSIFVHNNLTIIWFSKISPKPLQDKYFKMRGQLQSVRWHNYKYFPHTVYTTLSSCE